MYAHIEGIVAEKAADSIVLDAGGVGYLLSVSAATLGSCPAVGERMKLYCVLSVREDAMELFGFSTREEKRMFERLRNVSGVGSRTALQILSALSVRDLSVALVTGDAAVLTRAQGVGKKLAQRLVLELRDKVDDAELAGAGIPGAAPVNAGSMEADAVEALVGLGYSNAEASRAVAQAAGQTDKLDRLITLALRSLGS